MTEYNVGLTEQELTLIIRLIDDDDLSDDEETELRGIRRKMVLKRKNLRHRTGGTNEGRM